MASNVVNGNNKSGGPGKVLVPTAEGVIVQAEAVVIVAEDGSLGGVIGQTGSPADVITVTPVCEVSSLDAGDVAFDTIVITNAARLSGGTVRLDTISLIDKADQKAQLELVFFNALTSLGTLDAAPSISDANALTIVGRHTIAVADYLDIGGASIVNLGGIGKLMKTVGGRHLYVAAFVPGTPTYGAADALQFQFGFAQT